MTREEKDEIPFTILLGGWTRVQRIVQERLGRPVKPHDKSTMTDIIEARRHGPITADEMKSAYQQPGWAVTAERIIGQCRMLLAA